MQNQIIETIVIEVKTITLSSIIYLKIITNNINGMAPANCFKNIFVSPPTLKYFLVKYIKETDTDNSVTKMVIASPTSINEGTNSIESTILTDMPIMAEYSICLSLAKALSTWKPNIEERLTINIRGAVI
jgi:hypothetical protein